MLFYVLAISKIISGWVPTYDSAHSWCLCSAASLRHQSTGTMTCYPTQSHYPVTDPTSHCPILIMLSARLWSNKYQFLSCQFDVTRFRTRRVQIRTREVRIPQSSSMGDGCSNYRHYWLSNVSHLRFLYKKASLARHLPTWAHRLYRSLYLGPKWSTIQWVQTVCKLHGRSTDFMDGRELWTCSIYFNSLTDHPH